MTRPTAARAANAPHSHAESPTNRAQNAIQPLLGNRNSAERNTASRTSAVSTRVFSIGARAFPPALRETLRDPPAHAGFALGFLDLLAGASEAALALAIPGDRRVELLGVEVRPQRRGEIQFGIRKLPKQEIADALLATGANEQVGFGRVVEREVRSELLLGVPLGRKRGAAHELQQGLHQIPAAAVVGCNRERESHVARGEFFGAVRELDHARPEGRDIADDLQAHLVLVQALGFLLQGGHEQLLERRNLFGGSAPVLGAEGEKGQVFDADIGARTRDSTHRLDPLLVTRDARQIALFGPAAVAIHDDGYVPGDVAGGRDLARGAGEGFHVWSISGFDQTAISSASLAAIILSISAMCLSVSFWISSCARRSSSSDTDLLFSNSLSPWLASRRALRTATLAFSPSCLITLIKSRRRSSVRAGIGTRTMSP